MGMIMKFIKDIKVFFLQIALPIIVFTAGSDRLLKAYILKILRTVPEKSLTITSFFNITQVWNFGVSFGLLRADNFVGVLLLLLIASVIIGVLFYMLIKAQTFIEGIALSCIIGGALGNLFDRIYYGAVYDFLDVHFLNIHFWTFNPADVYISLGAILLVLDQIFLRCHNKKDSI